MISLSGSTSRFTRCDRALALWWEAPRGNVMAWGISICEASHAVREQRGWNMSIIMQHIEGDET